MRFSLQRRSGLCLAIAFVVCCGCSRPAPPAVAEADPYSPSHARMLQRLDDARTRAALEDPFHGDASVARAELRLARLSAGGPESERLDLHLQLADGYRRLGILREAVNHYEAAQALVRSAGDARREGELSREIGHTLMQAALGENCTYCQTSDSCVLPIIEDARYRFPEHSRNAIPHLRQALALNPEDIEARWLLNIAAMTIGDASVIDDAGVRFRADAFAVGAEFPRFEDVAFPTGVRSVGSAGGAAVEDFDGDGRLDLLASSHALSMPLRYFRNMGDGRFLEESAARGLDGIAGGSRLVLADFDNDGHVDVLVLRGAGHGVDSSNPSSLLRNDGGGRFEDVTSAVGLESLVGPVSCAAWADFDGDGDLDLFVGFETAPCRLFRNDGPDGFVDVTAQAGVENGRMTRAALAGDCTGDGRPELYLSNADGANRLYRNDGGLKFQDVAAELGVDGPEAGGEAWFCDVNQDGRLDIFAGGWNDRIEDITASFFGTSAAGTPCRLYLQTETGGFRDAAAEFALDLIAPVTGGGFADLDNDGSEDCFIGTGLPESNVPCPNRAFLGRPGGAFEDITFAGGFGHLQQTNTVVFADFDNDGALDLFLQVGGPQKGAAFGDVLLKNPGQVGHWLRVQLEGVTSNRRGLGVRVQATVRDDAGTRTITRWNLGGAGPLEMHLGLGAADQVERLEVHWPTSGTKQTFTDVAADGVIRIREDRSELERRTPPTFRLRSLLQAEPVRVPAAPEA
ncbi:MAG: CRTAC1 family protein [Planctomyces sp.]|nr:CRTAC1 family protein [Planctomyces sp.]